MIIADILLLTKLVFVLQKLCTHTHLYNGIYKKYITNILMFTCYSDCLTKLLTQTTVYRSPSARCCKPQSLESVVMFITSRRRCYQVRSVRHDPPLCEVRRLIRKQ